MSAASKLISEQNSSQGDIRMDSMSAQSASDSGNNAGVKEVVNRRFSQVAANYSTSTVHASGDDLNEMVRRANLNGSESVLDAGCGAGHTALAFAPVAGSVVAVDLSDAMLEQCRGLAAERQLDNVDFRRGDVEQLPLEDASFDLITSRYSAHHWPHPQRALSEFRRVLRPGGRFLLSDIVSFDDFSADTFLQTIELLRDSSHVRDHTVAGWLGMLAEAGFGAEVVFTWNLRLDFTSWVERMATPPAHVSMLRTVLDEAPSEVRVALRVEPDHSFTLPGALFQAVRS